MGLLHGREDSGGDRSHASHMPDTQPSRQEKRRLAAPGVLDSWETQLSSKTIPATASTPPTHMTAGQRLRR